MSGVAALRVECEVYGVDMWGFDGVIAEGAESNPEDDVLTIRNDIEHR